MQLAEAFVDIKGRDTGLSAAFAKARSETQATTASMEKNIDAVAAKANKVYLIIASILAVLGAAAGVRSAVKLAADWEQAEAAFTKMLGSAEAARAFMRELEEFAAKTPFELPGLIDGSRRLLAMGFTAEEVLPTLTAIGDAVAAMGGGVFEIDRVVRALGQMRAKGKVSAEEMMQLAELGIPVWEMLANKIGVSIPEAMKQAERGSIDAATGIGAVLEGITEKFGGSMEDQSQRLAGLWSTTKDTATSILRGIGFGIVKTFDLKQIAKWITELGEKIKWLIAYASPLFEKLSGVIQKVAAQIKERWTLLWEKHGEDLKKLFDFLLTVNYRAIEEGILIIGKAINMVLDAVDLLMRSPQMKLLLRLLDRLGGLKGVAPAPSAAPGGKPPVATTLGAKAAADKAAEDEKAAKEALSEWEKENASKLEAFYIERDKAMAEAGPKLRVALAKIYADKEKKLLAEIAKEEADKAREVYNARVALYEAEVAAYGQAWAAKLRMAGQEADAEKVLARSTFEAKARELMREFTEGKDTRMQMYAAYMEYIEACRGVDKREADRRAGIMQSEKQAWRDLGVVQLEEAGKAADAQKLAARNALYEQIDNLRKLQEAGEDTRQRELLAWAKFYQQCGQIDTQQREAALTKQAGVLEKIQALFEKYSLELTRITQGRTAAELLEIDREADKEATFIKENVKNQQQQADLLQSLAVITADKKQAISDQEMRTAEELGRRRREEERAKVGFISPTKVWEAATIAGMQRRYMEPPEMQPQRPYMGPPEMQARPPQTGLEAAGGILPNLGRYMDDSMAALQAIRRIMETSVQQLP